MKDSVLGAAGGGGKIGLDKNWEEAYTQKLSGAIDSTLYGPGEWVVGIILWNRATVSRPQKEREEI